MRNCPPAVSTPPGDLPLSATSYRIGWLAAAAIVALRLMIGLHFFLEGVGKLQDSKPFSGPFFANAKGPLAPVYRGMVWDPDGLYRLDSAATLDHWDHYRSRIVSHFGFDDGQKKRADAALKTQSDRYKNLLGSKREEIEEYRNWLARREQNADDPVRELASLQSHDARIATETRKLWSDLIPPIDRLWKDLESDLNAIATQEQWKAHGKLAIGKVGRGTFDAETMDAVMPYFNLAVGICLLLGLFTRPAAILAAIFLASVCASQWPGSVGAAPIYYQAVEMVALLVLAALGAGRYLGLDYFLGGLKAICCPAKKTGETK
jgi:uncharacterized membrane protein YphA (DoxX/SURF4 family)